MDEFNLKNESDIGTSISKLKKKEKQPTNDDILILINEITDRLDNIETKKVDSVQLYNKPVKKEEKNVLLNNKPIKNNYIEVFIYMIIFVLLNNIFIIGIIYKLPFIKNINSPYPNLILRTLLFGLIIFIYKKYLTL